MSRLRWFLLATLILFAVMAATLVTAWGETTATPIIRRATIHVHAWPRDAAPMTIALLSDIHIGNHAMDPDRLRRIVAQVDASKPDLVLIAGDFVTGHDAAGIGPRAAGLTEPLSRLRAPLGTIAVLGNHDHWTSAGVVRAALQKAGVTVLENHSVRRGPLAVVGLGDAYSNHADIVRSLGEWRRIGGFPLVLSHTPDVANILPRDASLVVAGHTHCGQVVLPLVGPLVRFLRGGERSLYDPRFRCGLLYQGGRLVIVTAGLGSGSAPLRLGAPPDWWLVTLAR